MPCEAPALIKAIKHKLGARQGCEPRNRSSDALFKMLLALPCEAQPSFFEEGALRLLGNRQ